MDLREIEQLLRSHRTGEIATPEAARRLANLHFEDIEHTRVDHARAARQGFPEVVFGAGKSRAQICEIVERLIARAPNVLITRTDAETYGEVRNVATDAEWHESARMIRIWRDHTELGAGEIGIVTAGTSDIPVAEEAALTAEAMGNRVARIWDAGVAGIHRLLAERERLRRFRVVVVAAGMEGAAHARPRTHLRSGARAQGQSPRHRHPRHTRLATDEPPHARSGLAFCVSFL